MRFKVIAALVVATALTGASEGVALATSRTSGTAGLAAKTPNAPAGGSVKILVTPSKTGNGGTILITGAIGDYGKTLSIDKNGKADPNGTYAKITLHKGTFEVNLTTFEAKANKAEFPIDKASCSSEGSVTGPVTLFKGTGLYEGIKGTANITETVAWILPRYTSGKNKGQCNGNQSLDYFSSITGNGTVSF
ncbi:MAG: hypothetical protein ABSE84_10695 [Isosphaeraceae bacterium]|jgi:hypothetical protein